MAINLATLPQEEMDAINLNKHVCLARHQMRGMGRLEREQHLKSIDQDLADHIRGLMKAKRKAMESK